MRYWHPVQAHERFIAKGRYGQFVAGAATEAWVQWTIHGLVDEAQFVRLDDGAGLTEALLNPAGQVERYDVLRAGLEMNVMLAATGIETTWRWQRGAWQTAHYAELPSALWPQDWLTLAQCWRAAAGQAALNLSTHRLGEATLQAMILPVQAQGCEDVYIPAKPGRAYPTQHIALGEWHLWLDEHVIPLRVQHGDERWVLVEYGHR